MTQSQNETPETAAQPPINALVLVGYLNVIKFPAITHAISGLNTIKRAVNYGEFFADAFDVRGDRVVV